MSAHQLTTRRPFSDLFDLSLMADPFSALAPFATGASRLSQGMHRDMPIDVKETDKQIDIHADIPGVSKDDIKIDVENDVLLLSVERKEDKDEEKQEEGVTWHHTERSHFFMQRSLRLPDNADMDNVSAAYKDGVLTLTVPKTEVAASKKRIAIS